MDKNGLCVLFLGQDRDYSERLRAAMEKLGCNARLAFFANEANKLFEIEKLRPDVVIFDQGFSDQDQRDVKSAARLLRADVTFISFGPAGRKANKRGGYAVKLGSVEDTAADLLSRALPERGITDEDTLSALGMQREGFVLHYNPVKRIGIIRMSGRDENLFFHKSSIVDAGETRMLIEGDRVEFLLNEHSPKGPHAEHIRLTWRSEKKKAA